MKRICVVGSGFAGFEAALQLDDALLGRRNVEVVLISATPHFVYTPLLPDVATGSVSPKSVMVRIEDAFESPRCRVVHDRVTRVDLEEMTLIAEGGTYPYNYLLMAVGSEADFQARTGVAQSAMTLRTLEDALRLKRQLLTAFQKVKRGELSREAQVSALTFVIAGGGQAGVEVAAELTSGVQQELLPLLDARQRELFKVVLVEPAPELLSEHSLELRGRAVEVLSKLGVELWFGDRVVGAVDGRVLMESGRKLLSDHLIWAAGRRAPEWLSDSGLPLTSSGNLPVDGHLSVKGARCVFAAGSCAELVDDIAVKRRRSYQVSSRQGGVVAENILHCLVGASYDMFTYEPLSEAVTLGRLDGVARVGPLSLSGVLARGVYRFGHMVQTPTMAKKLAMLTDWTDKFVRGRDLGRLLEAGTFATTAS